MTYQWVVPLAAAAGNAVLAAVVLAQERDRLRIAFGLLTGTLVLWNIDIFGLYFFSNPDFVFSWTRIFRAGPILAPTAIIWFAYLFAEKRDTWRRLALGLSATLSVVLLAANALDLLVVKLQRMEWGYYPAGTAIYNLVSINFAVALSYSAVTLLVELHWPDSAQKRLRARLWLLATIVALPLGLTNLLPAYGVRVYPLGNLANLIYVGIVAYAIVRHRLMDIDIVITKGAAYGGVGLAVIAPVFGLALWMQRASFGQIHPDFSFALLVMFLLVGILFPSLRTRAEARIERSLFGEKHSYRTVLSSFTRSIVRILDRDKLLRELSETLTRTLQLDRLAICLRGEGEHTYVVSHASGIPAAVAEFGEEHPLVVAVRPRDDGVLRDELEASTANSDQRAAITCQQNGWEVCVPLSVSGRLIGFIALGRKRNLEAFYAEDLQLLSTLAGEAAIALENARLYEELKKSRDIIERAGRLSALGTLAAGIAHEVRNPLVSIQTFFQLAPQRIHDEEFFTTFLSLTAGEVQRISNLITELLTFARSPSHAVHDVDVNDLIERTTLLLEPEARKHRVKLVRVLADDLPHLRADGDQLKQIIINLVLNAIQATDTGGTVTVLTRERTHRDQQLCEIEVRDTGVGIPPRMLDDIFNPFFTTKDTGTGLGLSIAHQIATEHGGFISVRSEEGRGSSFCVNLPFSDPTESPLPEDAVEADLPVRYGRMAKL